MFCTKCGKQLKNGAKFCVYCGTKVENKINTNNQPINIEKPVEQKPIQEVKPEVEKPIEEVKPEVQKVVEEVRPQPQPTYTQTYQYYPKQPKKKMSKKALFLIIGGGVILIALGVIGLIFLLSPTKVDVISDINVAVSGYDGYGRARVEVGSEFEAEGGLFKEQYEKIENKLNNAGCTIYSYDQKCQDYEEEREMLLALESSIEYTFSYEGTNQDDVHLKNGEKITLNVLYDQGLADALNIAIPQTTKTVVVEGLEDLEEKDIFEKISMKWIYNWYGFTVVPQEEDNEGYLINSSYTYDETTGVVHMTLSEDIVSGDLGVKPIDGSYEKDFNVGSIPQLVSSIDDVDKKKLEALAYDVVDNVYFAKCGWELYVPTKTSVKDRVIEDITFSGKYAYANVKITVGSKKYQASIPFMPCVDGSGEYFDAYSIDKNDIKCEGSHGVWKIH